MAKAKKKAQKVSLKNRVRPAIPPHIHRLYKAVAFYIKKAGGTISVVGGISIQQWPSDGQFRYTVCVRCTGNKPQFAASHADDSKEKP